MNLMGQLREKQRAYKMKYRHVIHHPKYYKSFADISVVLIRVILHSNMAFNRFNLKFKKTNQRRNHTKLRPSRFDLIWFIGYLLNENRFFDFLMTSHLFYEQNALTLFHIIFIWNQYALRIFFFFQHLSANIVLQWNPSNFYYFSAFNYTCSVKSEAE